VSGVGTEHSVREHASTPERIRMEGRVLRCTGSLDARTMRTQVPRFRSWSLASFGVSGDAPAERKLKGSVLLGTSGGSLPNRIQRTPALSSIPRGVHAELLHSIHRLRMARSLQQVGGLLVESMLLGGGKPREDLPNLPPELRDGQGDPVGIRTQGTVFLRYHPRSSSSFLETTPGLRRFSKQLLLEQVDSNSQDLWGDLLGALQVIISREGHGGGLRHGKNGHEESQAPDAAMQAAGLPARTPDRNRPQPASWEVRTPDPERESRWDS
jgi:hypothetical protein